MPTVVDDKYAPFTGEWDAEDGVVHIKGSTLIGADGSTLDLSIEDKTTCRFTVASEAFTAKLSADGRKLLWSDGAEWVRKGAPGAAQVEKPAAPAPAPAAAANRPSITLEQALNMQKELYGAFSEMDFQDALEEVEEKHGKGYTNLTRHHTELFLSVQNQILPKYGYPGGQRGVTQMFQDVSRFNTDKQFQRNRFMLNQLLGLLSPEEQEDGDDQEADNDASADGVEVVVHHFTDGTSMKVSVPPEATFYNVREILAQQVDNPEILEKGRLMRKQEGVFSAYNDKDQIGAVRDVILLKASLQKKDAEPPPDNRPLAEKLSSSGRGQMNNSRLLLNFPCSLSLLAERRMKREEQGEAEDAPPQRPAGGPVAKKQEPQRAAEARLQPLAQSKPFDPPARGAKHFLVLGGDDGSSFHDSVELFQADSMSFTAGPPMGAKRSSCAVAPSKDGQVLVFGGCVGAKCLDTTEVLSLEAMSFAPGPAMGVRRAACAAARIDERRVMVLGGRDRSARLESTEILDLQAMTFQPGPQMESRRAMCAAVMLDDQRLLVIGGHDGNAALSSTEVLDTSTMEFSPGPNLGTPRFSCAAALLDERRIIVLGGVSDGSARLETTEILNLSRGTFAPGPNLGTARSGCGVMMLDQQRLLVVGGHDGSIRHDTTEVFDLTSMRFTAGPQMSCRRGGCIAVSC
eukprot:CAMPEP_0171158806 /NCGR_PEP_ID=MMETSP0790-20130122/2703_1 /TAXON_ID=2925 /ORGANISM="Alexandrium catenella, Strain OF101" /LENGTH=685 /DNA_ID=CAMNT_0011623263 /DNA_START=148 /DNA_END=2205 /DNA_ORIENTATION=-